MKRYELSLIEDRFRPAETRALPAVNRVVYVVTGRLRVTSGNVPTEVGENQAWQGGGDCGLTAGPDGARAWRWELRPAGSSASNETATLAREVELDPAAGYLMRCDRVDFPPGGVAYTHTHQGPGIRVLLTGDFRVEAGGRTHSVRPGGAWFESGPEPVYAEGSKTEPTSFARMMVLPATLVGKSSIRYVKSEDQDRPKSQRYTIFVDAPIELR